MHDVTLRRVRGTVIDVENNKYHIFGVIVFVVFGIQLVMRMCHFVICGLPGSTKFSSLSQKRHDFRKKTIEHTMCVLICLQLLPFLILRRTDRDIIENVHWSSCKARVILVRF
jgi:hypothetical protein